MDKGTAISKALAIYLNQYQLIPYDRVEELFKDLFGQPFSEGSLFTANEICYKALEDAEQEIKHRLLNAPVINCDDYRNICIIETSLQIAV